MTRELNLPELKAYTREQLAKKWECEVSLVKSYIDNGQLKVALPPAAMTDFRREIFYKCEDNEPLLNPIDSDAGDSCQWLLEVLQDGEPLEKYIGRISYRKTKHCPEHLYVPIDEGAIIKEDDKDHNKVRYFYDLDGSALISILPEYANYDEDGHLIFFPSIKKEHLDSSIIPHEEVRRFLGTRKKPSTTVAAPKEKGTEQDGTGTPVPKTTNKISEDKHPPTPKRILRMNDVVERAGISKPQVYILMGKGQFPKSFKIVEGGRAVGWHESEIDEWIRDRDEQKQNEKESNE